MKLIKSKGFTIIEVIIVLVIGAVIMLAVFVVVPQLQRASREGQQRQIAQRVLVAARQAQEQGNCIIADYNGLTDNRNITSCITNVTGALKNPASAVSYIIYTNYRAARFRDYIYVVRNAKCVNNALVAAVGSIGVYYVVEPYTLNSSNPSISEGQARCVSDSN